MNYLKLVKAFWSNHQSEHFTGNETILYLRLVDLFSDEGTGDVWPDTLRLSDGTICAETGISPGTMDKFRKALVSRALIGFQPTGKGYRSGGEYRIIDTYSSPKRTSTSSPKRYSKNEELPERTLEIGELTEELPLKDTQQVPQKDTQKDTQNLGNSHIYKEFQTPNDQTPNTNTIVVGADDCFVGEEIKKKESPPPTPSQPAFVSPIPAAKVYGDGVLQKLVIDHYEQFPTMFGADIILNFLRHHTALVGGVEKWRTQNQFDIEIRLQSWTDKTKKFQTEQKDNGDQPATNELTTGGGQGEIIRTHYTKQSFGRIHSSTPGHTNG